MKDIPEDVLVALSTSEVDGNGLRLTGQLDRKLYTKTDKVLKAAGGKWNRNAKAHIFDGLAVDAIEPLLLTGQYADRKQDFGQFDTPEGLASELVQRAGVVQGHRVLEPSAGIGRIASAAQNAGGDVTAVEVDNQRFHTLCRNVEGARCHLADFLSLDGLSTFDRIIMNPPFAKGADVKHVTHAWGHLVSGGWLVAIMSASVTFRQDKNYSEFRKLMEFVGGEFVPLPDGSFKESGTSVRAVVAIANKP